MLDRLHVEGIMTLYSKVKNDISVAERQRLLAYLLGRAVEDASDDLFVDVIDFFLKEPIDPRDQSFLDLVSATARAVSRLFEGQWDADKILLLEKMISRTKLDGMDVLEKIADNIPRGVVELVATLDYIVYKKIWGEQIYEYKFSKFVEKPVLGVVDGLLTSHKLERDGFKHFVKIFHEIKDDWHKRLVVYAICRPFFGLADTVGSMYMRADVQERLLLAEELSRFLGRDLSHIFWSCMSDQVVHDFLAGFHEEFDRSPFIEEEFFRKLPIISLSRDKAYNILSTLVFFNQRLDLLEFLHEEIEKKSKRGETIEERDFLVIESSFDEVSSSERYPWLDGYRFFSHPDTHIAFRVRIKNFFYDVYYKGSLIERVVFLTPVLESRIGFSTKAVILHPREKEVYIKKLVLPQNKRMKTGILGMLQNGYERKLKLWKS